jgi:small membrane protein
MMIRVLLLAALAGIGWFIFLRRNRMPFHIVTLFGLLGAGAVAVVVPDETKDAVANFVGVGRGTDLVTYIAIVSGFFALLHYYTKFVEIQRALTAVTRELAILRAEVERLRGAETATAPRAPAPADTDRTRSSPDAAPRPPDPPDR